MGTTAEDVLKDVLLLSEGERARVAAELLASLEPDIETRDGAAWVAEVERRAQFAPEVPDELAEVVAWYELAVAHARRRPGYWLGRVRP